MTIPQRGEHLLRTVLDMNESVISSPIPRSTCVSSTGTLWGVGVGPGDPDLLTVKAIRVLRTVSVVAYPALLKGSSLARQIVSKVLNDGLYRAEIALRMQFDVSRASAQAAYDQGAVAIAVHLTAGRDVAVLCEGDPLFFGSFAYIMSRLNGNFPVEIIPGVNSIAACSSVLQHPFALLNDRATIIPAMRPSIEIKEALFVADAAAIIKVGRYLPKVVCVLNHLGLLEKAWYVERAGQPEQRVRPLSAVIADAESSSYFSMVLIHKTRERW